MWTDGMPYCGWYNGNLALMLGNGTYADFRDKIVERVENGFYDVGHKKGYGFTLLKKWDDEWEAIPIEERILRRDRVVRDSTPEAVQVISKDGVRTVMLSKPSENNNMDLANGNKDRKSKRKDKAPEKRRARGALTKDNDPLRKRASTTA